MKAAEELAFRAEVLARRPALRRTAVRLCGSWDEADDLVQASLLKLYLAWPLRDPGAAGGWLHRALVRGFLDSRRRGWGRYERAMATVPDRPNGVHPPGRAGDDLDADLAAALTRLPPRQRAALVLRFLEDQSIEQTADLLGCSTTAVRTSTSRGIKALRGQLPGATTPESSTRVTNPSRPTTERTTAP